MSTSYLIEELIATSNYPLTDQQAMQVLAILREQAARERVPVSEIVLCTDDVNRAAKRVIHAEEGRA